MQWINSIRKAIRAKILRLSENDTKGEIKTGNRSSMMFESKRTTRDKKRISLQFTGIGEEKRGSLLKKGGGRYQYKEHKVILKDGLFQIVAAKEKNKSSTGGET